MILNTAENQGEKPDLFDVMITAFFILCFQSGRGVWVYHIMFKL